METTHWELIFQPKMKLKGTDLYKFELLLDYLFPSGLMQALEYGITKL